MTDRYAVPAAEDCWASRVEVADVGNPLQALLEKEDGESMNGVGGADARSAIVRTAARRVRLAAEDAVEMDDGLREEFERVVCEAIAAEISEVRLLTLRAFLRFLWQGSRNPWDAFKNLLAATRLCSSELLCGVSQTEVGELLGETRAATSAREGRTVIELMRKWGVKGFLVEGALKPESAREKYREAQRGNRNRAGGKRR